MRIARRRFTELVKANQTKERPKPGKCNYPLNEGRKFCKKNAGIGTPHAGTGYCVTHDTTAYDPVSRYRGLKDKSLREQMEKLDSVERDVFDLIPEVTLLRALILDFVERFYRNQEALLAWHEEVGMRPKRLLDITEVTGMIEGVTRILERKHRIESKEAISLETFRRITEAMGMIVAKHVRDSRVLNRIEEDWGALSPDAKSYSGVTVPDEPQKLLGNAAPDDTDD